MNIQQRTPSADVAVLEAAGVDVRGGGGVQRYREFDCENDVGDAGEHTQSASRLIA